MTKKVKKIEFTEEQQKWNKMCELWAEGQVESPYAELLAYQAEVNNGGHAQYFCNAENAGDLHKEISALKTALSPKLQANLEKAYGVSLVPDEQLAEKILGQCDNVFYENEEEIFCALKEYAAKLEL